MADATPAKQVVRISAEIILGTDPFANAPILTAIGAAVKSAQSEIAQSGGDATSGFTFTVSVETQKPARVPRVPRVPRTPPAPPAAPAAPAATTPAPTAGAPPKS